MTTLDTVLGSLVSRGLGERDTSSLCLNQKFRVDYDDQVGSPYAVRFVDLTADERLYVVKHRTWTWGKYGIKDWREWAVSLEDAVKWTEQQIRAFLLYNDVETWRPYGDFTEVAVFGTLVRVVFAGGQWSDRRVSARLLVPAHGEHISPAGVGCHIAGAYSDGTLLASIDWNPDRRPDERLYVEVGTADVEIYDMMSLTKKEKLFLNGLPRRSHACHDGSMRYLVPRDAWSNMAVTRD